MKKKKVILIVLSISLSTLMLLATFVSIQKDSFLQDSREVLQNRNPIRLEDHNLVDYLHELKLTAQISKVKWNSGVLTLDLRAGDESSDPSDIYEDIATVASFSFEETVNVQQLMLRVMAEDEWMGSRHLLLSADIRRSEWSLEALQLLETWKSAKLPEELKIWFHMSETNLWRRQFILR